jgi:hypothetical protein
MMNRTARAILVATAVAGTLDIAMAFVTSDRSPDAILRSIASGPFGAAMNEGGLPASVLGLAVHFSIMAAMAAVFVLAGGRWTRLLAQPVLSGLVYGLGLYLLMYWVVLPLRWPEAFPITEPEEVGKALFAHMVLVGLPIALIAARHQRG